MTCRALQLFYILNTKLQSKIFRHGPPGWRSGLGHCIAVLDVPPETLGSSPGPVAADHGREGLFKRICFTILKLKHFIDLVPPFDDLVKSLVFGHIFLAYVRYILQSETVIVEVVCGDIKMRGVVQNKSVSDWIVSYQSEYQSQ